MNEYHSGTIRGRRYGALGLLLALTIGGCGAVHGTDGKTLTTLGIARWTEGQTQSEIGAGKGMDNNLSTARPGTFNDRSPAMSSMYNK